MKKMLPGTITLTIALLTVFFCFIAALNYLVLDNFLRTRIIMTSFFFFIVTTLTISFWQYTLITLPYTIPAFGIGLIGGYLLGVRAAEKRLHAEGLAFYTRHFAHIEVRGFTKMKWWIFINYYSIMGALVLINFVGISTVLFRNNTAFAITTSVVGAFLIGSIAPYLIHLWRINATHHASSTSNER